MNTSHLSRSLVLGLGICLTAQLPSVAASGKDILLMSHTITPSMSKGSANTGKAAATGADNVRALLIPSMDTTLSSPIAGRIKSIRSELGTSFHAGDVLASFDCEEPVARRSVAKAELAGAVETHEAKLRLRGLDQASDVEVSLAASAVAKSKAQVALGDAQVSQCTLKAPWSGRIAKAHVRNHMSINAGQPMLELVKAGPLKLKLSIPSRWVAKVKVGTEFQVFIDETGKSYGAEVAAINSRVDAVGQSLEVEAQIIKTHGELLAGMSGTAKFDVASR
jgi:membrane fusion protein (multidrug efflux system)